MSPSGRSAEPARLPTPSETPATAAGRDRVRPGLRREVALLLPLALLVLALLETFTLLSYRNALELLVAARRDEAGHLAKAVAETYASAPSMSVAELWRRVPAASGVALLDATGAPIASAGDVPPVPLPFGTLLRGDRPAPRGGRAVSAADELGATSLAVGPDPSLPGAIAGFAPVPGGGAARYVRVDLPATALAAKLRGLRILLPVALGATALVTLVVLLFLRHLFAPFDSLLAQARAAGQLEGAREDDEIAALVATFERALAALAHAGEGGPTAAAAGGEAELAVLERALGPSLSSGVLLLDSEGGVLALNAVGAETLSMPTPAPGTPVAVAFASQPEFARLLGEALDSRRGLARQEVVVAAGAGERTLGVTLHALRRDDGGVRGHLVFFADLTDARRAEAESQLAHSLAQLGELAAGVAHELRNSLATLNGYLALIARRPGEESITDYLTEIRRESGHLQRVVEDFLAFASPGTARLEEVDLETILRRAASDPTLAQAAIEIRGADPRARLRGDPQLLERALRNLLHNAAQAQRRESEGRAADPAAVAVPIEASIEVERVAARIAICDRGAGIPEELRARLFQPFSAGRPGGVGLGLALARRIVLLHGGTLRLEDRPGGGTRAVVTLPFVPSQALGEPEVQSDGLASARP